MVIYNLLEGPLTLKMILLYYHNDLESLLLKAWIQLLTKGHMHTYMLIHIQSMIIFILQIHMELSVRNINKLALNEWQLNK